MRAERATAPRRTICASCEPTGRSRRLLRGFCELEDDRTRGLARREPSLCLRPHDRPRVRSRARSHGGPGPDNPVQVRRERSTMARGEIARSAPHTGEFVDEVPSTATPLIPGVAVRLTEEHRHPMSEMVLGHIPGSRAGAERAGDSVRSPPPPDSRSLRVAHATDHAPPICDRSTPTCVNCVSPDAQTTTQLADLEPRQVTIFATGVRHDGQGQPVQPRSAEAHLSGRSSHDARHPA